MKGSIASHTGTNSIHPKWIGGAAVSSMKMNLEMEDIRCPICEGSESLPLHQEGSFRMVRCFSCAFIYLNPRPTQESLLRFYQTYLPEEELSIQAWEKMMRLVFHRAATRIQKYKTEGRLLDVGAGFGFFLKEMRGRGWEGLGIEISQKAIDYARETLGLTIHPGPLEKAGFPESSFDVVSGFYVVEHLSCPMTFLKECYRILKPRGLLLLRYPHTTPIKNLLHLLGIENRLYDLPAHLSDFSPGMIQGCLEQVGFVRCKHLIGGYTQPVEFGKRLATSFFGNLSEALFYLSGKRFLFPGVSKTVLAFKGHLP